MGNLDQMVGIMSKLRSVRGHGRRSPSGLTSLTAACNAVMVFFGVAFRVSVMVAPARLANGLAGVFT